MMTGTSAASASVNVIVAVPSASDTVTSSIDTATVSSFSIVASAVAVRRYTPDGSVTPDSLTANFSFASTVVSAVVCTSRVAEVLPASIVTSVAAWAV